MKQSIALLSIVGSLCIGYVQAPVAMRITSRSTYPLTLYFASKKTPVAIPPGGTYSGMVDRLTKIELTGFPDYGINEVVDNILSGVSPVEIPATVDDVFVAKAYNDNNIPVLSFLLKNGLNPLGRLSDIAQMAIMNNAIRPTAVARGMVMLRGAPSGSGLQRYHALLPAAVYDGKIDIVKTILAETKIGGTQSFAESTLARIAESSPSPNSLEIKELLQTHV